MGKALIIGKGETNQRIQSALGQVGFEPVVFAEGGSGWPGLHKLREENPDLFIINEDYVTAEGYEIIPAIRHLTTAPLIVIGLAEEKAVVNALIQGADAYLSCSASEQVVLSHVNALLRRQPSPSVA